MNLFESGRGALRKIYFQLHWLRGDGTRLLNRIRDRGWVVSLNLHRVSPDVNHFYPPLRPDLFDELVAYLREHFEITTYDRLREQKNDKPPLVLSFDDGYYDFLEHAAPILAKYSVPANQNLVCDCLVSGKPIWNVQLYDFLNQAPSKLLAELRFPGWDGGNLTGSITHRAQLGLALSRLLKNLSRKERMVQWRQIESLMERCDNLRFTPVLSVEDARAVAKNHQVGVHSFEHDSMAFENDDFFARDVLRCREYFRDQLRLPLNTYAFPNGSYRNNQVQHLLEASFEHILLVDEQFGAVSSPVQPRLTFYGDSSPELRLRSLGYFAKGGRCES